MKHANVASCHEWNELILRAVDDAAGTACFPGADAAAVPRADLRAVPRATAPSCAPTAAPTAREPTPGPSPAPTPRPSAAPSPGWPAGCVDDENWHKKNAPSKDCAWVSDYPGGRCLVVGADDSVAHELRSSLRLLRAADAAALAGAAVRRASASAPPPTAAPAASPTPPPTAAPVAAPPDPTPAPSPKPSLAPSPRPTPNPTPNPTPDPTPEPRPSRRRRRRFAASAAGSPADRLRRLRQDSLEGTVSRQALDDHLVELIDHLDHTTALARDAADPPRDSSGSAPDGVSVQVEMAADPPAPPADLSPMNVVVEDPFTDDEDDHEAHIHLDEPTSPLPSHVLARLAEKPRAAGV
ncbi:N2-acetyl-L-ornithine:2-oxoglutarate 5-aminotransferase [Aureococcus anophagefferens]|nr:N2-acetyl-L-ornithine:2-oxoglutarate 5-aminotransferase [Aureococcus anophagefferens]